MGPLQKGNHASVLVDLGTHGVHTVHNTLKDGEVASGWKMKTLMSLLHKIFNKSSSNHADYKNITESNDKEFPILFVSHRCVENEPVTKSGGPAIPVNVMLFEEVTKNLIRFLTLFQTDQPMALFITETNFPVRFFMEKCILKSALSKVHSSISVAEIDLNEVTR